MPSIQLLSEETINQIAAGEVIENPACVIKELVENSLDAGATKITVEISEGGLKLIRVIDNGSGMEAEDARLSLQRHATSKMRHFKDLFKLTTMGFRGEALAAIGAVSKLTLTTSVTKVGIKIEMEGGTLKSERAAGRARGTTVEVSQLFYNVPARKKFQKSAAALSAEIFRLVTQLALGSPSVHFELITNGRKSLSIPPSLSLHQCAEMLIGAEFATHCFSIDFKEGGLELAGLLGSPQIARPNRLGQYLFLNGRAIYCATLNFAIRDAYGTRLDDKRHPVYLLHLQLPTDLVDVNVHPQKREVRLRDERLIKQRVQEAIASAFNASAPPAKSVSFERPDFSFSALPFSLREEPSFSMELPFQQDETRILGLFVSYLLVEGASVSSQYDGLLLVDLRLVRFRLIYDQLMQSSSNKEKQGLLLPFTIDCTPVEAAMMLTHLDAIESLGFIIRPAGKELFLIEALPPFLQMEDVKPLLGELSQLLQEFIGKSDIEERRRSALALATARFAKNRQSFNVEEARELMRALRTSSDPAHSPQGHPTMVHLSRDELQKLFSN